MIQCPHMSGANVCTICMELEVTKRSHKLFVTQFAAAIDKAERDLYRKSIRAATRDVKAEIKDQLAKRSS